MVSYIRALMVELGEACHEASLQIVTDDEVLVEVEGGHDGAHRLTWATS